MEETEKSGQKIRSSIGKLQLLGAKMNAKCTLFLLSRQKINMQELFAFSFEFDVHDNIFTNSG